MLQGFQIVGRLKWLAESAQIKVVAAMNAKLSEENSSKTDSKVILAIDNTIENLTIASPSPFGTLPLPWCQ